MGNLSATSTGSVQGVPGNAMTTVAASIREFLAFKLGEEEYGIDILRVQEIRSFEQPTRMANSPLHVLGMVNLRGVMVPIIDMRLRFNLESVRDEAFTVVIVLNLDQRVIGVVVDDVSDVVSFTAEQLHPVPEFTSSIGNDHLLAIGSIGARMLILLDIERLMGSADMGLTAETTQ